MATNSNTIPVYRLDVFSTDTSFFWMGSLCGIQENYPHLLLPHRQMYYSLIHAPEPAGHIVIDHEKIDLGPLQVICIKPGSIVQAAINGTSGGYWISFAENFFSLRYNSNVLQRFSFFNREAGAGLMLHENDTEKWQSLNALMLDEYQKEGSEQVLRSYLNIILNELDRSNDIHVAGKISGRLDKVIQFERLVEEHYCEWKTPVAYATQLYITTNYLNKLCQEYRSITAGELIRKRIVLEAQRLLHHTTLSVGEIADELGFENLSYFVTFFKKNTGLTPETFRRSR